jgi:hypothetical protein
MSKVADPSRVQKPYPEFPLTAHRNGSWCKKVRGEIICFGAVSVHGFLGKSVFEV